MRSGTALGALCVGMVALCASPPLARADSKANRRFLFFSGVDVSSLSAFSWAGAEVSLFRSRDVSGPAVRVTGGMGSYDYDKEDAPDGEVRGTVVLGEFLAGWRHIGTAMCLGIFGGFAIEDHELDVPDPGNEVQGTETGAKIAAELFWRPSKVWQVEASAAYATTFDFWRVRLAGGRAAWRGMVVGAETEAFGNAGSDQARLGLFVSDIGWRNYDFKLSAGALRDNEDAGMYARFGMDKSF
jgi:hypothetical protein